MTITIEAINNKLDSLKVNKDVVETRIKEASDTIKQANADLNAIAGAIQVCEQLLSEQSSEGQDGGTN
tara:strand:- start:500 stop:703 length:204 start_codon:yes stop_codon:yes gene_type:complete